MEFKQLLNNGWQFTKQPIKSTYEYIRTEPVIWTDVEIPHDWLIYNTNDLYETSMGWYKNTFSVDLSLNKNVNIYFEGVYMDSTIFINGKNLGGWKYGYSSFEFDITDSLVDGENEIIVQVSYQSPNTRWYSGAGIYRNVWLKITEPIYIESDSIYISTRKESDGWYLDIDSTIINKFTQSDNRQLLLNHQLLNHEGTVVATTQQPINLLNTKTNDSQVLYVKNPKLWNLDSSYLYHVKSQIIADNTIIYEECQRIGFRTICFDPNKGFILNNLPIKLQGVNQHHDLGALGAAVNKIALKRQINKLKEMGVNAIRLSHNMPSVEIMDLADEMGVIIVSEAFDCWEYPKNEYDYARYFNECYSKDIASWVRRDRNHPCVIMWSIGNEIPDTTSDRGLEITKLLKEQVLIHDPRQNAHVTIGSNHMTSEKAQACSNELVVAGYNYAERLYNEHHLKYPHWCIYGSETSSTVQSRGIYHFPAHKSVVMYEDEQCSSLDNCTTTWGSKNAEANIIYDRDAKFSMGQFLWSGFDYIGEPTPYTTKNSYFGQIDTAGFEKDSFYLYQAEWTNYKNNPMIHLLPYWDFNEGQIIDIIAYSNAPKVELFFNEVSQGICEIDHISGTKLRGEWQLPYQKGTLKAVAYDEFNNIIATDIQNSFSDATKIQLKPDKTTILADGKDLIFVEISTLDSNNTHVANANNRIFVEVSGGGRLVGLDNGDSTDYDQYKGTSRRLFSGKLLAIIASKTTPSSIQMKVYSEGLPSETISFEAITSPNCDVNMTIVNENTKSEVNSEIPIRKIQLAREGLSTLNQTNPTAIVSAKLLPENTTYDEIEWKAITDLGTPTNIVMIEPNKNSAKITALGDGKFRLRCTAKNGGSIPQIISDLEYEIEGLGTLITNAYEFVDATLFSSSIPNLDDSLIGGIDTKENVENIITYSDIDFGDYGTDEITLSIYQFSKDAIAFEIWEGVPGNNDSSLILKSNYQVDPIWCTFQENSFKLSSKIKGIKTISFVFREKLSFKGFEFSYKEKAFEKLYSSDIDDIYGDYYTINKNTIDNIGNNVSLEIKGMNFGEIGTQSITICGESFVNNVIQLHFINDNEKISHIIEFPHNTSCETMNFPLPGIKGKYNFSLVFMPGDNFNYHWLQFNN